MGVAFGCVGNTIRLRSGNYFDLSEPKQDQFTIEDVAGALSKICRFGGQIDRFYSVAEHSVLCMKVAESDGLSFNDRFACLMHDATEAFVGDCVKPLKMMLRDFDEIESRVERVIEAKFGIDFCGAKSSVRKIDHEMLIAERRALFSVDDVQWAGESTVRRIKPLISCMPPDQAEDEFLHEAIKMIQAKKEGAA